MSRLDELKTELARLTVQRAKQVQQLKAEIEAVNQDFDRRAVALGHEIAKREAVLGASQEPAPAPKARKPRRDKATRDVMALINEFNRKNGLPEVRQ